tara:strand:- start:558 stop:854 length:297 start_codon:yes stop_codon:yes gene_type:complete
MPPKMWFDLKVPVKRNRPTKEEWDRIDSRKTREKMLGITDSKQAEKVVKLLKKKRKRKRCSTTKEEEDKKAMPPPPPRLLHGIIKRNDAISYKKHKAF